MFDIQLRAPNGAASLRAIGRALGAAGIGMEGGGMWSGVAHYVVADGELAAKVLRDNGFREVTGTPVAVVEVDADAAYAVLGKPGMPTPFRA